MRFLITAIFLLCFVATSCDPDVAAEKVTLPPVTFAFKVSNDTPYLRVGDTLNIRAAISSTVNGITLTDGEGMIASYLGKGENIPRISFDDVSSALNTIDYHLIIKGGGVKRGASSSNSIIRFSGHPVGDSIIMDYTFVFLKPGLYQIGGLQSSFYEGSKGKGRWDAYFDVSDPHWDFVDMPSAPPPQPGEPGYLKSYLVAVTQ
jgi:hypothetical protein